MKPLILAIDDDAERYGHLRSLLGDRAGLIVASCAVCIARYLPSASAVLLDYDLDPRPCLMCGALVTHKGDAHVAALHAARVPTVVVTASRDGARAINYGFRARETAARLGRADRPRRATHSAIDPDPEIRWIGQLWTWGVL